MSVKHLYIFFNDGQRMSLAFPTQKEDPLQAIRGLREQMNTPFISFGVDGDLLMIPRESIKYIQVCPAPSGLPELTIRGASLLE